MTDLTLFVGLDVHKKTISVAVVEAAAGAVVRFYGTIANTPDSVRTLWGSSYTFATRPDRAATGCTGS
jgi:hypothetical protein